MNARLQMLSAALCILLIVIITGSACGEVVPEGQYSYLTGDFAVNGTILTDEEQEIETTLEVSIAFRVVADQEGELTMSLATLNLLARNVSTGMGDSGPIGLALVMPEYVTPYNPSTGEITTEFSSTLHYELIDQIEGYQQFEPEGEEDDVLVPFTEVMVGNLTGELPHNLQIMGDGNESDCEGGVKLLINPDYTVLGSVRQIEFSFFEALKWRLWGCQVLRIQPVFIGTGPTDPDRTGIAFDDLMANATEIWDRCGTVRCLKFDVLEPIYLNKTEYKIIENSVEVGNLKAEVDATDALEVFVVQNLTILECGWGGGICYSIGTESAKIVSCDSQLSVPCPCPCSGCRWEPCECGPVNYYHLAHELGHALNLFHPEDSIKSTATSIMEWSGWCNDNPDVQSAKNCRNAKNPLLRVYLCSVQSCSQSPDIND